MIQLIENKGRRYTLPVTNAGGSNSLATAFSAYLGVEGALGEADGDVVAESDLIGRAQNVSGGVVGDGVPALEQLERAALLELKRGGFELAPPRDQRAIDLDAQVGERVLERAAKFADASAQIERRKANCAASKRRCFRVATRSSAARRAACC